MPYRLHLAIHFATIDPDPIVDLDDRSDATDARTGSHRRLASQEHGEDLLSRPLDLGPHGTQAVGQSALLEHFDGGSDMTAVRPRAVVGGAAEPNEPGGPSDVAQR